MNPSKKYGIIAGVATVGYMLLFYLIDRTLILNMKVYWSSLLIYFICMYKACMEIRSSHENEVLHLKDAIRASFITFLIANAIFYIFYYILLNFVDPDLVKLQVEIAQQMYLDIMGEERAKPMLDRMEEEGFEMTFSKTFFEYAKGAIAGFVFSLLIGGFTRQE
ncbi:MAG: DUF4199 domain-containing protein [Saprospiraceae bacterium]